MKNLNCYTSPPIDLYITASDRKETIDLRNRLIALRPAISLQYGVYDGHYAANTFGQLYHNILFDPNRADLLSLYDYGSRAIRDFRISLESLQPISIKYTCQQCSLGATETLDHLLPKEEFPEYAVHPVNLIPCCSRCNGYKSFVWRNGGNRLFLNLYLDQLPDEQYLFVEVFNDDAGEIDFEFYLDNSGGIDPDLFAIIESHFNRLHLLERFRMKVISSITELENSILARAIHLNRNEIINEVIDVAKRNMLSYGFNYYKSIFEIKVIQSPEFHQRIGWV